MLVADPAKSKGIQRPPRPDDYGIGHRGWFPPLPGRMVHFSRTLGTFGRGGLRPARPRLRRGHHEIDPHVAR